MVQFTVGYVAGVIAAGFFVARLWSPNTLTFILSGVLRDRNSAATWTVASRALQRSHWPDVLRTDSLLNHGVRKDVVLLTKVISLMGAVISVAGIITPLGLYEALVLSDNEEVPFRYLKDVSPFGLGTPDRSNYTFNRMCSDKYGLFYIACPFSDTVAISTSNSSWVGMDYPHGYNITIPQIITDIYSSGSNDNTTISNYFDIQWRRYQITSDLSSLVINNGSSYLVSSFRNMQTLVLNNAIQPVEGLIVDTVSGGIGFRNHTVPPGFQHGVTWQEDLLFIEPETVCVDTNLTIDFTIALSVNISTLVTDVVLTDRGGFVNLNQTVPVPDLSDTQSNADLFGRAYTAAWLNNAYTMLYFNVTDEINSSLGTKGFSYLNSTIDKVFPLPEPGAGSSDPTFLKITSSFGDYLGLNASEGNSSSGNPFQVTSNNFTAATALCSGVNSTEFGVSSTDFANITNIYVSCGLIYGVPQRLDSGNKLIFDAGSRWSQPLHACASAVKATIKTVSFNYNGTEGLLSSLHVDKIEGKTYPDQSSIPLWGVENTGNAYTVSQMSLIWGLVNSSYESHPNVSTVRQSHLYLPGYSPSNFGILPLDSVGSENLPGSDFFSGAIESAYTVPAASIISVTDYTGQVDMAMWAYWQNLSKSATTASLIPNLIFTDTAAAAVVGTKGILGPGNAAARNLVPILVTPTVMSIRYHWPFAIPALIVAVALLLMSFFALTTLIFKRHNFSTMRRRINNISPGRIYTAMLYPEQGGIQGGSKEWNRHMGSKMVDLSGVYPSGDDIQAPIEKGARVTVYEQGVSDEHTIEGEGFLLSAVKHHRERSKSGTTGRFCGDCGRATIT